MIRSNESLTNTNGTRKSPMWILWKNVIEDEKHFICPSSFYNDLRNSLYLKINYTQPEFQSMSI